MIRCKMFVARLKRKNHNVVDVFRENVAKLKNKPIFHYNDKTWTFKELDDYSTKVANCLTRECGLVAGNEVALFMESRPEYGEC